MKIDSESKFMILNEIEFVVSKMEENPDITKGLYYFSGIHSIINRIYNQHFNEDLVFLHFVLQSTHTAFNNRLSAIKKGGDNTVPLLEGQISALSGYLKELAKVIEEDKSFTNILKKFTILLYSTTGNGYYLLQKGMLSF